MKKPEATVITTLTVTHILRDCTADEATEVAELLAEAAADALRAAYAERVLPQGQADDVCVSGVQIFELEAR